MFSIRPSLCCYYYNKILLSFELLLLVWHASVRKYIANLLYMKLFVGIIEKILSGIFILILLYNIM